MKYNSNETINECKFKDDIFVEKNKFQQKIKPVQTDIQISITMLHKIPCPLWSMKCIYPDYIVELGQARNHHRENHGFLKNYNHNISQCILSNIVHFREKNRRSNPSSKISVE